MSIAENRLLPTALAQHANLLRQEIALGSLGVALRDSNIYTRYKVNNEEVKEFKKEANRGLSERITKFVKPQQTVPSYQFNLLPIINSGNCHSDEYGYTFSDGKAGFLLSCTKPSGVDVNLAAVTFATPNSMPFNLNWDKIDKNKLMPNSIVILQLQSHIYYDNQIAKDRSAILEKFRWEHLLVELAIDFAIYAHLKAVYIQPATLNKYITEDTIPSKRNRFKVRYDVTAQRMNFMQREDELYELLL